MDESFLKAVNDNDVIMARILLKGEVLVDPRLVRFREMQQYAESKLSDLYEDHDGESFEVPETQWTDELHGKIQKDLNANFSKARLDFYAKMAPIVLRAKVVELQQTEPIDLEPIQQTPTQESQTEDTERSSCETSHSNVCQMDENFANAVNDGDVIMARILLKGEVLVDPRLVRFREMQQYAESKLTDLYEDHDGESFDVPETQWTDELHGKIQKDLNSNFSKARLDFYAKMAPVVLKAKVVELQQTEPIDFDVIQHDTTQDIRIEDTERNSSGTSHSKECQMEETFVKAVNEGDVLMTRILLKGEVLVDPRLVRFREMQQYAESKLSDLYEDHDGELFEVPETQWTDELHGKIQKDLNVNFSKVRLDFYAKMAPIVLRAKVVELQQTEPIDSSVTQQKETIENQTEFSKIKNNGNVDENEPTSSQISPNSLCGNSNLNKSENSNDAKGKKKNNIIIIAIVIIAVIAVLILMFSLYGTTEPSAK